MHKLISNQGNSSQITMDAISHPLGEAELRSGNVNVGKNVKQWERLYSVSGNANWQNHFVKQFGINYKDEYGILYNLAILFHKKPLMRSSKRNPCK